MAKDADQLTLDWLPRTWGTNDEIVLTTTDYLPSHSEKLKISGKWAGPDVVIFEAVDSPTKKIQWPHNGVRYGGPRDRSGPGWDPYRNLWSTRLDDRLQKTLDPDLLKNGAETRAAVALLTRSIRIVSAGDAAADRISPSGDQRLFLRRPHGRPPGLQNCPDSGRRVRADGPRRPARLTIPSTSTWRGKTPANT